MSVTALPALALIVRMNCSLSLTRAPSTATTTSPGCTPAALAGPGTAPGLAHPPVASDATQALASTSAGWPSTTRPTANEAMRTSTIVMTKCMNEPADSTTVRRPAGCL